MKLFIRSLASLLLFASVFGCSHDSRQEVPVLSVYNWANYIGKDTIASFEKEFHVRVAYDNFSNNEELLAKLQAGAQNFDVIVPSDYMVETMRELHLLAPLDRTQLTHFNNLDPHYLNQSYDPQNLYSVPYHIGIVGLAVNTKKIPEKVTSFRALFDERYRNRIAMLDDPRSAFIVPLSILGLPMNTVDPQHIKAAQELLLKQKSLVKAYTSDTYTDFLRTEEIWIAQSYTGEAYQLAREKPEVQFIIPDEPTELAIDNLCVSRGSKQHALAMQFIDYILRADVAAAIANDIRYPTANRAARALIQPEILKNPNIYPSEAVMARLVLQKNLKEHSRLYDQAWSEVKAF
jgi:spermidine/putrescine transport system substrate-binding protein